MSQKSALTIKTRYQTRPNSNVGKVVANITASRMTRSVVIDQSLTAEANARRAAEALAAAAGMRVVRALDSMPTGTSYGAPNSRYAWEYELEWT